MRVANPVSLQRIVDTAASLFAEHRYHEVRMDDIAVRAGVSKGALYRHFKDKDDLYLELILRGIGQLYDDVKARISGAQAPEDKLSEFVHEVVRFFTSNPSYLGLIQRAEELPSAQAETLRESREQFLELLIAVLCELDASGRWSIGNPKLAALGLIGMTREILRWHSPVPRDLSQQIVGQFLHGVAKT